MQVLPIFLLLLLVLFDPSTSAAIPGSSNCALGMRCRMSPMMSLSGLTSMGNSGDVSMPTFTDVKTVAKRLPSAVTKATRAGISGFCSTAALMIPFALLFNINKVSQPRVWWDKSFRMGVDWGRTSACFVAGEMLAKTLRGKEDRWNNYIGSGIGSAATRYAQGPKAMASGFALGFTFMYAFDIILAGQKSSLGAGAGAGAPLDLQNLFSKK